MYKELCERLIKRDDLDKELFILRLEKLIKAKKLTEPEVESYLFRLNKEE